VAFVTIRSTSGERSPAGVSGDLRPESATTKRILFDINHPAQVHLFRNAIAELEAHGHETYVTSRHKEVTVDLLDAFEIDHEPLSVKGTSVPSLARELLVREVRMLSVARQFDPDAIVGRPSPAPAHVSSIVGCPFVAVMDTHFDSSTIRRLYQSVTFPCVDAICVPRGFDLSIGADKRRDLDFQELSYLHPRYFEPDAEVLRDQGIDPQSPYFVVRMAGWDAHHDVGHEGLSPEAVRALVSFLSDRGTVYISAENGVPADLAAHELPTRPEDVHQVLYFADLYVGDSGTMSSEAAILGTPAIRTNSMVGDEDEAIFRSLENRYELLQSFRDTQEAIEAVRTLTEGGIDRHVYEERRQRLLSDQPDATRRMVETVMETVRDDE
jgi:predicted glycosyltransferase